MSQRNPVPTVASFEKDVERHRLTVVRSDGLYRHLRFARPETGCMSFNIVTWPGHLCYSGDMGIFVFQRLDDMLEFFRRTDRSYRIDFRYWAEKCIAADRHDGLEEFSPEGFVAAVNDYRRTWVIDGKENGTLDKDERRSLWEAVQEDVLDNLDEADESLARQRVHDFSWSIDPRSRAWVYSFDDFHDRRVTAYTQRFVWCCYALAWGIRRFDDETTAAAGIGVAA